METAVVSITDRDSDVVLYPSGHLNHLVASELRAGFDEIIRKHAKPTVLVDLGNVESVDAEAISILVKAERSLKKRGVTLGIVGANPAVQRVFRLLGISHLLIT